MIKFLQKLTALLLVLGLLGAIGFFIIYPNYSQIKIFLYSLNPQTISQNSTVNMFAQFTKPAMAVESTQQGLPTTLEHLTSEALAQHIQTNGALHKVEDKETTLTIDSANIQGKVVDGENADALERGFWYYPLSAPPGEKGNTVIIAHRFQYLPPRTDTFFSLDTVKIGDKITIHQSDNIYNYTIVESFVVEKDDRRVLMHTNDHRITLITCTPLWTSDQRLVVVGKLDKIYGTI